MLPLWLTQNYDFFIQLSITAGILTTTHFAFHLIHRKLKAYTHQSERKWDNTLVESLGMPIQWGIFVIGATWMLDITAAHMSVADNHIEYISKCRQIALTLLLALSFLRLIARIERQKLQDGLDPTTVQLISKIAKIVVIIVVILPLIRIFGVSLTAIATFSGAGGLVAGLALKDLLSNFFAWCTLSLDKQIKVGEWIKAGDASYEGIVESINFRTTLIRTFDKREYYLPNQTLVNSGLINCSRMTHRRIYLKDVGVRYNDAERIPYIIDDIEKMLIKHDRIDKNQALIVNLNSFEASSLSFFVYCLTDETRWQEFHILKQEIMLNILTIIRQHGGDCAFPTQTLFIERDDENPLS